MFIILYLLCCYEECWEHKRRGKNYTGLRTGHDWGREKRRNSTREISRRESLIATRGLWVRGGRKRILVPAVLLEDDESNERKVSFKPITRIIFSTAPANKMDFI